MPGLMVQVLMMLLVTVLMVMVMMMVAGVHGAILGARVKADILMGSFLPMFPTSSRLWRWVVPHFTGPGW